MSLTGTPFLYTLIALSVVALALPLALWSRVRGPRALRAATRALMLLFAQGTAVALVFTLVNNANNLYDNWADLLGTGDHVQQAADLGADGTGGIALKRLPKVRQTFRPATGPGMRAAGGVRVTQLKGRVSGVNAEVYVWLRRSTTNRPTGTTGSRSWSCCPATPARRRPGSARCTRTSSWSR
ncbi:hypothetical protein SAFG77S_04994 [Streptomyces afghaniensis]